MQMAQTLFEKIWKSHTVVQKDDGPTLLYVDRHLVHEVTSPQAFAGLRETGRKVRRPDLTVATVDHNVPTEKRTLPILDQDSAAQIHALEKNCSDFGVRLYGMDSQNQVILTSISECWHVVIYFATVRSGRLAYAATGSKNAPSYTDVCKRCVVFLHHSM